MQQNTASRTNRITDLPRLASSRTEGLAMSSCGELISFRLLGANVNPDVNVTNDPMVEALYLGFRKILPYYKAGTPYRFLDDEDLRNTVYLLYSPWRFNRGGLSGCNHELAASKFRDLAWRAVYSIEGARVGRALAYLLCLTSIAPEEFAERRVIASQILRVDCNIFIANYEQKLLYDFASEMCRLHAIGESQSTPIDK
jgi:hypothetical protein